MSGLHIHKNGTPEVIESSDGRLTLSVPIQFKRRAGRKLITLPNGDLGLVMEEANRADVSLPVTALVGQLLSDVSAMGLANADWCSLMQRQRRVQSGK